MKIRHKLFAGLGFVFFLLVAVGAFGLIGSRLIVQHFSSGEEELRSLVGMATEISSHAKRAESHLFLYLLLNRTSDREKFFSLHSELKQRIKALEIDSPDHETEKLLAGLKIHAAKLLPAGGNLIKQHDRDLEINGAFDPAKYDQLISSVYTASSALRRNGLNLAAIHLERERILKKTALEKARRIQRAILSVICLSTAIALLLCIKMSRGIVTSIKQLQLATKQIGLGRLDTPITVLASDEIGDLSQSLATMARDLHATMISKDYVDSIIKSLAEGLIVVSTGGTIERVNDSFCLMTGFAEKQLIGMRLEDIFAGPPLWPENGFAEAVQAAKLRGVETFLSNVAGDQTPILFSAANIVDNRDNISGVVCIAQDISAQKETEHELQLYRDQLELRVLERTVDLKNSNDRLREENLQRRLAEKALKESEAHYRAIVEDQTELIRRCKPDRTITFVNEAFCDYFNLPQRQITGRSCLEFVLEDDREEVHRIIEGLSAQSPFATYEHRVLSTDTNEIYWQQWTSRVIVDEGGKVREFQSVGRDITRQKQMERELKRSAEKVKLFAFSVSHDLKNPAIGIYGLTKRLRDKYGESLDEKGMKICEQIYRSAEQINELVEKINLYITTKESPLNIEKISFSEILLLLEEEFSSQFRIRNIAWKIPENLPWMNADRISLVRILRNLIDNALKYGGDSLSKITVDYQESEEHHIISVWNNGSCIKKEAAEGLFGLFKRSTADREIAGAGLGLAIVKEIAEQHGGRSWLEPGQKHGVTFYFSIAKKASLQKI